MSYDVNPYKFDSRTKEEFIKDMEKGLSNEMKAIRTFEEILRNSNVENPKIIYVGSEEEGKVAMEGDNVQNIPIFPDYMATWKNSSHRIRYRLIEVKTCTNHSQFAFFKRNQLEQYHELGSISILFVMGVNTSTPRFTIVEPQEILSLGIEPQTVYGKDTYKVHISLLKWDNFTVFKRDYNIIEKSYIVRR